MQVCIQGGNQLKTSIADSNYIECNDIDASKDYVVRFQIYLKVI